MLTQACLTRYTVLKSNGFVRNEPNKEAEESVSRVLYKMHSYHIQWSSTVETVETTVQTRCCACFWGVCSYWLQYTALCPYKSFPNWFCSVLYCRQERTVWTLAWQLASDSSPTVVSTAVELSKPKWLCFKNWYIFFEAELAVIFGLLWYCFTQFGRFMTQLPVIMVHITALLSTVFLR